jgi:hypothetical protein
MRLIMAVDTEIRNSWQEIYRKRRLGGVFYRPPNPAALIT